MTPEQTATIINATDEGWHVVAVMVPTRALRVIRDAMSLIFRVEQLDPTGNVFKWRVVSTHTGDESFESFLPALSDAITKQARLKEKIKLAQHEDRMARVKAQST